MMIGMLLAIFAYRPIYDAMYKSVNLKDKTIVEKSIETKRTVKEHGKIVGDSLISFHTAKTFTDGTLLKKDSVVHWSPKGAVLKADGTPEAAKVTTAITVESNTRWYLAFLVFIQVLFVTMVYGPIAAFLVEMFPVRIRYTSMSLPYHIGNGIFGGLLPAVSTYLVTNAKDAGNPQFYLEGLWYPIAVAAVCLVIGVLYLDGKDRNVKD
jgi:flagellar biosynthesis protein FliP